MPHSALPPAEDLQLVQLADIARGGMGMVQLCRVSGGRLAGRFVAVKRLNPAIEQEPEFVNMFLDETWITATINSPHVVKVEAWGRDEMGLYLAVELVQGVSLSRLMKESREMKEPFAERTVAFIMSQICAGLAAAHGLRGENGALLGVVHRDLTPGNILLGFDGLVKIADFGIAKAEERLTSTRIGMMKGKPAYMAPEQARGGGIDARADLFALGVVTYELLSGRRPWTGKNDLETLIAVSTSEPQDLTEFRRVSPVFAEIVSKCLKKVPSQRFSSAAEIKELLDAWRRERGFDHDDKESLAAFVTRNTPQQRAWFQQALSGGLRQGGVTFSDLEARIDAGRGTKTTGPQPAPRAAAAKPAPEPHPPPPAAPPPPQELEQIDENARTRYMGQSPAARALNGPRHEGFGSTVALPPEQKAIIAQQAGPASRGADLPLPPRRSPALGASASPATVSFAPHVATSATGTSGTFAAVSRPVSAPVSSAHGGVMSAQGALSTPFPGVVAPYEAPPPTDPHPSSDLQNPGLEAPVWEGAALRRTRWGLVVAFFCLVAGALGAVYWFVLRPRYGW